MTRSVKASDLIGERVRDLRQRRGMTAEQLADRCAELGASQISAAVLANIETGRRDKATGHRRRDVTIEEVLILARALVVPPALLFVPLDGRTRLQITPELDISSWEALFWVAGESEPSDRKERQRWREVAGPVTLHREFRECLRAVNRLQASGTAKAAEAQLKELAKIAEWMLNSGITPPAVPAEVHAVMKSRGWLEHPDDVPIRAEAVDS